jgi:hypothetical protein
MEKLRSRQNAEPCFLYRRFGEGHAPSGANIVGAGIPSVTGVEFRS